MRKSEARKFIKRAKGFYEVEKSFELIKKLAKVVGYGNF
jgi:hypothetical protein